MKEASYNMKPQDVVILFKLLIRRNEGWTQSVLSEELSISQSEISESIKRSKYSGMINSFENSVNKKAFFDFIVHGLKYVFPQRPGVMTRGIPTAHSAPFFKNHFLSEEDYVWPDAKGKTRGQSIGPLFKSVSKAVQKDEELYIYLALADIIRVGKAREKEMAINMLIERLDYAEGRNY